jgi:hypothetical protein
MEPTPQSNPNDAFRVPNSVLQGLTMATPAELNTLPAFTMTTLLGLLTLVDPKRPDREVRTKASKILEIIEVSRTVAHAVDREWTTGGGEEQRKHYTARRFSPSHLQRLHAALLDLHSRTVVVRRTGRGRNARQEDRIVHIVDMFGYSYKANGRELDVHDLPQGRTRVNVGTPERPVWRVRRRRGEEEVDEKPAGIMFRLSKELADEIAGVRGTINFTLLARRVFAVLRAFRRDPAAIRLVLLTFRQRGGEFTRRLGRLLADLGWDPSHRTRAEGRLEATLKTMKEMRLIEGYEMAPEMDRLTRIIHKGPRVGDRLVRLGP